MSEPPRIISVDDRVVQPRDLWAARPTQRYRGRGPRVEAEKAAERATGQLHGGVAEVVMEDLHFARVESSRSSHDGSTDLGRSCAHRTSVATSI
jgi:hypothetical protein